MRKGLIIDNYNSLFSSDLETYVSDIDVDTLSVTIDGGGMQLPPLPESLKKYDINIRCVPDNGCVESALRLGCKSVTIVADSAHRLEYSFGIDVLKFKPLLRELASLCHTYNIRCGISTDFRHENILHAQDCGADFVEIDFAQYGMYKEHYDLGIEIAKERELETVKKNQNILVTI